ncbi:DUF6214 family protein [Streptomyces sp. NPDC051098]|uniref:DUF6214 family protein n=1 Tax=Streptomyces sp. NPDC051098 TaxID=3155411 RepID=UPI00342AF662
MQGHGTVTTLESLPACELAQPWFNVRLTFADGARIEVLAVVDQGRIAIEDMRADPPLPLRTFTVLADRIEDPLEDACRTAAGQVPCAVTPPDAPDAPDDRDRGSAPPPSRRRARTTLPRGAAGRQLAADVYHRARQDGRDPVLAVMGATGHSRRKALRLIAGARDEGHLPPRHNRR